MVGPGPRVLVVDDDPVIRRFLRVGLKATGFSVFEAGSAGAVSTAVASIRPDAIILDLGLPDGSGIEVIRALRESVQTPILVLSVREEETEKIAALDAGADDFLTKPSGIGELLARLRVCLRHTCPVKAGPRSGTATSPWTCRSASSPWPAARRSSRRPNMTS